MRSFFKSELETLKIKTGLNQYENISALPDAEHQFKLLFDSLEDVCSQFPYIPDNDKKRIVQEQIYRDQDFNQLTPRVLWKWLEREKGKYFREAAHIPSESNAKAVTYEELTSETKQAVDQFIKALQSDNAGLKKVPVVTHEEIDSIKLEDLEQKEGKKAESTHYKTNPELVIMHEKKSEWMRLYHDILTGKKNENWISFEEYLKTDTQ